jgi:hypothetical protein
MRNRALSFLIDEIGKIKLAEALGNVRRALK